MKVTSFIISAVLVLCLTAVVLAQGGKAEIGHATSTALPVVTTFFKALRNGDVDVLKNCMGGELYESRKVLLEKNEGYPDFLRQLYHDVTFNVDSIDPQKNGDILVNVSVDFEDGRTSINRLMLSKNDVGHYEIIGIREE